MHDTVGHLAPLPNEHWMVDPFNERCSTDCKHSWHGLPCIAMGCTCQTSFKDRHE